MDKKVTWIVWLAVLSLVLNVYTLRSLHEQRDTLHNLQDQVNYRNDGYLASQISSLSQRIDKIGADQQWVIHTDFNPTNAMSTREEIHLEMDLSLRESQKASTVYIMYMPKNESEWRKVAAERVGGASFKATLLVEPTRDYRYKIVEETHDAIRTSELGNVPTFAYQPVPVYAGGMSFSTNTKGVMLDLRLDIEQPGDVKLDFYRVKEIRAEFYEGEKLVRNETLPVTSSNWGTRWELDIRPAGKYTKVVLEAEFADGKVERAEVWPDAEKLKETKYLFNP